MSFPAPPVGGANLPLLLPALGLQDGRKMKAPIPLLILLYSTIVQGLKVVSKRGSGRPGYALRSPAVSPSTGRNGPV